MVTLTSLDLRLKLVSMMNENFIHHHIELNPEETFHYFEWNGESQGDDPRNPLMISEMISVINQMIPNINFGEGNINTGKTHHKFIVGREYSRVIYLEFAKAYLPKNYNYEKLIEILHEVGEEYDCDEHDLVHNTDFFITNDRNNGSFKFRFWWDQ